MADQLVDIYNVDLSNWFNESPIHRAEYVNEALGEFKISEAEPDIFKTLSFAQYKEIDQLVVNVLDFLGESHE